MVQSPLSLEEIREYGLKNKNRFLVSDVEILWKSEEKNSYGEMWNTAYEAPHKFASVLDRRWIVILDEFQNLNEFIYRDQDCQSKDETMAGSYHEHSESKVVPMLVTGSYVDGLLMWSISILKRGD